MSIDEKVVQCMNTIKISNKKEKEVEDGSKFKLNWKLRTKNEVNFWERLWSEIKLKKKTPIQLWDALNRGSLTGMRAVSAANKVEGNIFISLNLIALQIFSKYLIWALVFHHRSVFFKEQCKNKPFFIVNLIIKIGNTIILV